MECGNKVIDQRVKENMKQCLADIQSGKFAKEWMEEYRQYGFSKLNEEIEKLRQHPLEVTGKQVRQMMWPDNKEYE